MQRFDTVIVSDLHLGARNSRAAEFLDFLTDLRCDRLILAGDVFDNPGLRGLTPLHVGVLARLRRLAAKHEVIWIRGNHDPAPEFCTAVLGVEFRNEYLLSAHGRRYLVCHGHAWDRSIELPWIVVEGADAIYRGAQQLDPTHRLARQLKRKSKWFCGAVNAIRRRAIWAARRRGLDGVIIGHSHVASEVRWRDVHYVNCGCWTERPAGYVGVRGDHVRQYAWDAQPAHAPRHSAVPVSEALSAVIPPAWQPMLGKSGWEHTAAASPAEPAPLVSSASSS